MEVKIFVKNCKLKAEAEKYFIEKMKDEISKYFSEAIKASITIVKEGINYIVKIIVNEGTRKHHTLIKSDAADTDYQQAFNRAVEKVAKQLRRYKRRLTNHRRKTHEELNNAETFDAVAKKYVFQPLTETNDNEEDFTTSHPPIIAERDVEIEVLSVKDAVMRMDMLNLPTLVFINVATGQLNVVYYRKDGNISWIDPDYIMKKDQ